LYAPIANVAPLTFSRVLTLILSLPPSVKVPSSSSTVPEPADSPVVSMVMEPEADRNWLPLPEPVLVSRFVPDTTSGLPPAPMPPEPAVSEMVPAAAVMSTAASPDWIAPVPLVVSVTLPPAASIAPEPLNTMFLFEPVVMFTSVVAVREMAPLTVILPLLPSPMLIVPAVTLSNSTSVRPNVPAASAAPRLIGMWLLRGRSVTVPVPALITGFAVPKLVQSEIKEMDVWFATIVVPLSSATLIPALVAPLLPRVPMI